MTSNDLLNAFKAFTGAPSDRALAREVLKVDPMSLRDMRERGLSDARAIQMAQALKLNVGEVLATIRAERSKDPAVRRAWAKIARTLRASAAAAVLAVFVPFPSAHATIEAAACILRQIIRRARLAWIFAALALAGPGVQAANASCRLDAAAGAGKIDLRQDGNWHQDASPLPQSLDRTDRVFSLGINCDWHSWLSWSVRYIDRGRTTVDGIFVSDENYVARQFAPALRGHIVVRDYNRGIALTLDPQIARGNWRAFGRIGVYAFQDRVDAWLAAPVDAPLHKAFRDYRTGATPYAALGVGYGSAYVQIDADKRGHNTSGVGKGNRGVMIGARVEFYPCATTRHWARRAAARRLEREQAALSAAALFRTPLFRSALAKPARLGARRRAPLPAFTFGHRDTSCISRRSPRQ